LSFLADFILFFIEIDIKYPSIISQDTNNSAN
jgi:hypothetical protein